MTRSIELAVQMWLLAPTSWTPTPTTLSYTADDPWAVKIRFGGGDVAWLLGRELLREGLARPAGRGDVRVWPSRGAPDVLYLYLSAPAGKALLEMPRTAVAAFLRSTDALVPPGAETVRVDEGLRELFPNEDAS